MTISLDVSSDTPIYIQLQNQIIEAIAKKQLKEQDALPSIRKLARDLGVNLPLIKRTIPSGRRDTLQLLEEKVL